MEHNSLIPRFTASGVFYTLASLALVILAFVYFDSIIKPIIIALLIWFVIHQLKITLEKITYRGKSLPPLASSTLAILIIFLLIYLVAELLILNIEGIVASMPDYLMKFEDSFRQLSALIRDPKYTEYLQKWLEGLNLGGMATGIVNSLSGIVANSAVVIVYVIFFILEERIQKGRIDKLFPGKGEDYRRFLDNMKNISQAVRSYIWSMTLISFLTGAISYIILLIMKVEYAFLWSFLIFILNFVPYIGPLISSLLPAIFAVLVTGDPWQLVYVFVAMEGIQVLLGNFIQPRLMGKGSNLGPVTVLIALAFWGMIWGIVGMILAVPIMSVVVIACSQIPSARFIAILLSEKGEIGGG